MNVKSLKKFTPALILTLSLSGCTSNSGPAQIENKQNIVFTRNGAMEMIRVYPHDTIESIAEQRNIPVEILAATNNLAYPYHIYNMRTLMIPQNKYHIVKSNNETMKSISKKHRVDLMQLMDMNNMTNISVKQHFEDHSLTPVYAPTKEYDVMELDEVKNESPSQYKPQLIESQNYTEEPISDDSSNIAFEQDLKETLSQPSKDDIPMTSDTNDGFKSLTPLNSQLFIWPLSGVISRDNKDGITISAPLNTPVRAAGSGKVIFAENDNGEYGNLVIIKHQDKYLSAYAYNNQILVKKGDEVNKGQIISKVGKSGKVSKPQLFFSMRRGKDIINPEQDLE
jgi:murein DD-endopeptidase MepM/ murein hydrolase activator NlpD